MKAVNEAILEQAKAIEAILDEKGANDLLLLHVGDKTIVPTISWYAAATIPPCKSAVRSFGGAFAPAEAAIAQS